MLYEAIIILSIVESALGIELINALANKSSRNQGLVDFLQVYKITKNGVPFELNYN